jgi:hypothetical protein
MTRDSAVLFVRRGRHLERAALTIRMLAAMQDDNIDRVCRDVRRIGLLRALAALHMYHRSVGEPVSGPSAMRFLLGEASCPRSVGFCLDSALGIVAQLPLSDRIAESQDMWRARPEICAWEASSAGGSTPASVVWRTPRPRSPMPLRPPTSSTASTARRARHPDGRPRSARVAHPGSAGTCVSPPGAPRSAGAVRGRRSARRGRSRSHSDCWPR